jgi:hypothetical protein
MLVVHGRAAPWLKPRWLCWLSRVSPVMTQMETKRSPKSIKPSHQVISQLRPKHPLHRARLATYEGRQQIVQKEEKTEGMKEHLLPPQAILRSYPPLDLYCGCSRSRVISPVSYRCDSGIRGSYPQHWCGGGDGAPHPNPNQAISGAGLTRR